MGCAAVRTFGRLCSTDAARCLSDRAREPAFASTSRQSLRRQEGDRRPRSHTLRFSARRRLSLTSHGHRSPVARGTVPDVVARFVEDRLAVLLMARVADHQEVAHAAATLSRLARGRADARHPANALRHAEGERVSALRLAWIFLGQCYCQTGKATPMPSSRCCVPWAQSLATQLASSCDLAMASRCARIFTFSALFSCHEL